MRGSDPRADIERLLGVEAADSLMKHAYRPVALLHELRCALGGAAEGQPLWMLDTQLNALSDAIGGCERLASTPIPCPYAVLLHRTIGAATPVIAVFVSFTLFALEAIAQEIGDPFGTAPNSLALDAMCRTIERSVLDLCGEPLPAELTAGKDYRLN
ncbi:MAG TPA: bestrophin family ion channel [Pseudoduganella sp.]